MDCGCNLKMEILWIQVYKLRVENPFRNDCWLVLRRYTDFVRLNNKLKSMIPTLALTLPRKKIFGDNFGTGFLDNRVQGLQLFVNSIMGNDRLKHLQVVKDFFCLDEPPTYSESMEECRVSERDECCRCARAEISEYFRRFLRRKRRRSHI